MDAIVSDGGGVVSPLAVTSVLILSILKFPTCVMSVPVPMAENVMSTPMSICCIFCISFYYTIFKHFGQELNLAFFGVIYILMP